MMRTERIDTYLDRIGAARPARPDADALAALQRAHLARVPFENLSIHLGERIVLDEDRLYEKIVDRRRGGFCYELNGAFAALLRGLGYGVGLRAARVYGKGGRLGPPLDHMALVVEDRWLVDVGFGAFSAEPLLFAAREDQRDRAGVFRIAEAGEAGDLDVLQDGEPQYRLEAHPRELSEFAPTCWYQQTSPDSHFTRSLTCSLARPGGRITLSGNRLIRTEGGERHEELLDDAAVLRAYREEFGIVLDRLPVITPRS